MPGKLPREKIEEIIVAYKENDEKVTHAAEDVDASQSTVNKYVNKWEDGEITNLDIPYDSPALSGDGGGGENGGGGGADEAPPGFTAQPPNKSTPDSDEPDFSEMDEGDFIEWFFSNRGFGVKTNFANNLSEQCRLRAEIPDEAEMANLILSHSSGIANDSDASMIAENYWAVAQRYLRANGRGGGGPTHAPSGNWVNGEQQGMGTGMGNGGSAVGGDWVGTDGQQGQQQGQQRGGGRPRAAPGGGGGRGHGDGQRAQQQGGGNDEIREEIDELRETVAELTRHVAREEKRDRGGRRQQQEQDKGPSTLKEQAMEIAEAKDALEAVVGENGDEAAAERAMSELKNELRDLKRRVDEEGDGSVNVEGDSDIAALAQLAGDDDIDPETLSVLADSMGVTDPEVKKAEFEYKAQERKMENRRQLVDAVFDNLSDVSGDLGAAMFDMLASGDEDDDGGGDGGGDSESVGPADPSAGRGELQVVGDEGGVDRQGGDGRVGRFRGGQSEGGRSAGERAGGAGAGAGGSGGESVENMSPARRRHADKVEGGGDDGGEAGGGSRQGGFRGPPPEDEDPSPSECQWMSDDGQCRDPAVEGEPFCSQHLEQSKEER